MKKLVYILLVTIIFSVFTPLASVNQGNFSAGNIFQFVQAKKKDKKKTKKQKKTEERLKKMKDMGVPKRFYVDKYGNDLTLAEMGSFISNWFLWQYQTYGKITSPAGVPEPPKPLPADPVNIVNNNTDIKPVTKGELMKNEGFESGCDGWSDGCKTSGYIAAHGGTKYAMLGTTGGKDVTRQYIDLPAETNKITLSFWYQYIDSSYSDEGYSAIMFYPVDIYQDAKPFYPDSTGQVWKNKTFDLTSLKGHRIAVSFIMDNKYADKNGLRVDDVSVNAQ